MKTIKIFFAILIAVVCMATIGFADEIDDGSLLEENGVIFHIDGYVSDNTIEFILFADNVSGDDIEGFYADVTMQDENGVSIANRHFEYDGIFENGATLEAAFEGEEFIQFSITWGSIKNTVVFAKYEEDVQDNNIKSNAEKIEEEISEEINTETKEDRESIDSLSDSEFIDAIMGTYESYDDIIVIDHSMVYRYVDSASSRESEYYISEINGEKCLRIDSEGFMGEVYVLRDGEMFWNGGMIEDNGSLDFIFGEDYFKTEKISDEYEQLKKPTIGMTETEAINSYWGRPKKVNKTTTAGNIHEQWVYSGNRYLYFDNGILTAIQE